MLTILAWMVFVPCVPLNMALWWLIFFEPGHINWRLFRSWFQAGVLVAGLFVPGVYLFGWV